MLLWMKGIYYWLGHSCPIVSKRHPIKALDYPAAAARQFGARARYMGISASNFILPLLQQGQVVISMPVSCNIIFSNEACMLAAGAGNFNSLRMVFNLAIRLRLARKP